MKPCPDTPPTTLERLLQDLYQARRHDDLGRLALLAYCEVRRWARQAGETGLADRSAALVIDCPQTGRAAFLHQVDALLADLEAARLRLLACQPAD